MPPSTRVSRGFSAATASAAILIIAANMVQPGSISKSQCDLLLGSFQNITASITLNLLQLISRLDDARHFRGPANENFRLRMGHDLKPRAAQHRFHTSAIRNPPVRRIAAEMPLDEIHLRKLRI